MTKRIENLCSKGLKRSAKFTWMNMANDYLKLYELFIQSNLKNNKLLQDKETQLIEVQSVKSIMPKI
jgi:hypothetical protein